MDETTALVDEIYRAAIDPDGWDDAMASLQRMFRCSSIGLYSSDVGRADLAVVHVRDLDPAYVSSFTERFLCDNPWLGVPELQRPGVLRTELSLDRHYNDRGYYRRSSFFNEWLKPQDFVHSLGTTLHADGGLNTKVFLFRPGQGGPFTDAEQLRFRGVARHLERGVDVARQLALKESRAGNALGLLESLNFGIVFLDDALQVMQANRFAETLFHADGGLSVRKRELGATHRADNRSLSAMLHASLAVHLGLSTNLPPPLAVRKAGEGRPLQVTAVPLLRRTGNPFLLRQAALIVMISDPALEAGVPTRWLHERYGLTDTESRLVQELIGGAKLREAAEQHTLSYETARWYMKIIYKKTGTSGQAQLIGQLLREQAGLRPD